MAIRDIWSECNYNPSEQLLFYPNGLLLRGPHSCPALRQLVYSLLTRGPIKRRGFNEIGSGLHVVNGKAMSI